MKKLVSVTLVSLLMLALVACGQDKIAGRWVMDGMTDGEQSISISGMMGLLGLDTGSSMVFVFDADGTYELMIGEYSLMGGNWTRKGKVYTFLLAGEEVQGTLDGDTLSLGDGELTIILKRA